MVLRGGRIVKLGCHHLEIRETYGKIITQSETQAFEKIAKDYFKQTRRRYIPEYWVPLEWAVRLVKKAGNNPNEPTIGNMVQVSSKPKMKHSPGDFGSYNTNQIKF